MTKVLQMPGSFTGMAVPPKETTYIYLLKQEGKVLKFNKLTKSFDKDLTFLDLSDRINEVYSKKPMKTSWPDERGLLNLTFHPDYNTEASLFKGVFIVMYSRISDPKLYTPGLDRTTRIPDHMTCISQFVYTKGNTSEQTKATERIIICYPEPEANHNGGGLAWSPQGYLMIGTGDGGGANDEHGLLLNPQIKDSFLGNAQNKLNIHGKILRIEIIQPMDQSGTYIIPANNPFSSRRDVGLPELMAWGFRNPWRMSQSKSGLWVGDVGQSKFEMVKLVNKLGGNYGWRAYEGTTIFNQSVHRRIETTRESITLPMISYGRNIGVAIVGVFQVGNELIIADHSGRLMKAKRPGNRWVLETLIKTKLHFHSLNKDGSTFYIFTKDPESKSSIIYTFSSIISTKTRITMPVSTPPKQIKPSSSPKAIVPQTIPSPVASSSNPGNVTSLTPVTISNNTLTAIRLTERDIKKIRNQCIAKAKKVKSGLRMPNGKCTHTKMQVSIIKRGEEKAILIYSEDDAWYGSILISGAKARTALYFSSNENALTSRDIGNLSQPGKPLWQIGQMFKDGLCSFPGGVPLYKDRVLVGAVGVSGDGVDQDETVAVAGSVGFEAPEEIRSTIANLKYIGKPAEECPVPTSNSPPNHKVTVEQFKYVLNRPLNMVGGQTYIFNQSDPSNKTHPMRFSLKPDSNIAYNTTAVGTPGTLGATVTFKPAKGITEVYMYCIVHGYEMGSKYNPVQIT